MMGFDWVVKLKRFCPFFCYLLEENLIQFVNFAEVLQALYVSPVTYPESLYSVSILLECRGGLSVPYKLALRLGSV